MGHDVRRGRGGEGGSECGGGGEGTEADGCGGEGWQLQGLRRQWRGRRRRRGWRERAMAVVVRVGARAVVRG